MANPFRAIARRLKGRATPLEHVKNAALRFGPMPCKRNITMEKFIHKPALAEILGVSVRTLENWVAHRGFPAPLHLEGSRLAFFKVSAVESWMEQALEATQ